LINPITGLLEDAPGVDLSSDFYVFSTALQHQFSTEMNLVPFTGVAYGVDTNRLSNSPNPKKVCTNDNEYITIMQDDIQAINGIRIEFFDETGALIGFMLSFTGAQPNASQFTVNVGLDGISNLVALDGFFPPFTTFGSYNVQFGYITVSPGPSYAFLAQTEKYIYNVTGDCCEKKTLRLHWMNLLGGADSFTFKYDKDLKLSTSYDEGSKALGWEIGSANPHNLSDVGKMKLKSEGVSFYEVDSGILTNAQADWLQDLLMSPKVYAEIDGNFIPVIIDKKTQSITRNAGKIRMAIVAILANDKIIPRL